MTDHADRRVSEQIAYYRARAAEYDATSLGDVEAAGRWFSGVLEELAPRGAVLEIACGTGLWTQHLVQRAESVTALDSSPEMIELATTRIGEKAAKFVAADVLGWELRRRYDCVFFAFWLSHVPPELFGTFWQLLREWLLPGGRVLFVDEGALRKWNEPEARAGSGHLVERRLRDGRTFEIVKVFYDRGELVRRLADLGWSADVWQSAEGFLVGTASP